MTKIYFSLWFFLLIYLAYPCGLCFANNTSYIALSNQIARKRQLEVVANNAANINTVGYEEDDILLRKVDVKQNSKRKNSFVWAETNYKSGNQGALKITGKPSDIAIGGEGYFKIITPKGLRYTLDGNMIINNDYVLANKDGYPYASIDNEPITIPENFQSFEVAEDGTIFVDQEAISTIGVFTFTDPSSLIKEGNSLYKSANNDIPVEDYHIISGALRSSNVNPTMVMAKMVEMQRAVGGANNLMSDVNELDRSLISKLSK